MTRELTRKLAYAELRQQYNNEYIKQVAIEVVVTILKVAAVVATFYCIAYKIGEPSVGGGPAFLVKALGLCYGMSVVYFAVINIKNIKRSLNRKYRKDKVIMMMEFSED